MYQIPRKGKAEVTPKMERGRGSVENNFAKVAVQLMVFHANSFHGKGRFSCVYLFVNKWTIPTQTFLTSFQILIFFFFWHFLCGGWDAFHRKKLRICWFLICFPDWKKPRLL